MNEGRKVDKSLYRDMITDFARVSGAANFTVTDEHVDKLWNETGSDPWKLYRMDAEASGDDPYKVTPEYMDREYAKYTEVDPS